MLTKTYSAALTGIEALPLEVEVNASGRGEQDFVSIGRTARCGGPRKP